MARRRRSWRRRGRLLAAEAAAERAAAERAAAERMAASQAAEEAARARRADAARAAAEEAERMLAIVRVQEREARCAAERAAKRLAPGLLCTCGGLKCACSRCSSAAVMHALQHKSRRREVALVRIEPARA